MASGRKAPVKLIVGIWGSWALVVGLVYALTIWERRDHKTMASIKQYAEQPIYFGLRLPHRFRARKQNGAYRAVSVASSLDSLWSLAAVQSGSGGRLVVDGQ